MEVDMINSSYLSRVLALGYSLIAIYTIGYIVNFFLNGFNIVSTITLVIFIGVAFLFTSYAVSLKKCMGKSIAVLKT